MDFFATYYKERFFGMKYLAFKKHKSHPKLVLDMLKEECKALVVR